jgi:hypothetical protein
MMKNIFYAIFADIENKLENGSLNDKLKLLNEVFEYRNVDILNKDKEVVEQRLKSLNQLIEYFRNQGIKKKDDKLTHENYLCRKLDKLADYLLTQYDEEYSKFKDYTMLNEYGRVMNQKREVGISYEEVEEYAGETYLSDAMLKGLEVHIDMIEQYASKSASEFEDVYKLSEDEKKKMRDEYVKGKLDKSPMLKQMFEEWLKLGEIYGFAAKDEETRNEIQSFWIEKFKNEKHPLTPKQRMYRLREMYHHLGYELFEVAKNIANPTVVKNKDSNIQDDNQIEQAIEKVFDMGDPRHVAGLLTIQRDKKGNFHPIFVMLEEKHKNHIDSPIRHILDECKYVLKFADLSEIERDIVDLIIQEPKIMKEAQRFTNRNPYTMIVDYINEKYGLSKTKRDIIHTVDKISRIVANTYIDLKKEVGMKKCTYCEKEKLASLNNFGRDTRNKSGLKSICRKCASEKEKLRRKII